MVSSCCVASGGNSAEPSGNRIWVLSCAGAATGCAAAGWSVALSATVVVEDGAGSGGVSLLSVALAAAAVPAVAAAVAVVVAALSAVAAASVTADSIALVALAALSLAA